MTLRFRQTIARLFQKTEEIVNNNSLIQALESVVENDNAYTDEAIAAIVFPTPTTTQTLQQVLTAGNDGGGLDIFNVLFLKDSASINSVSIQNRYLVDNSSVIKFDWQNLAFPTLAGGGTQMVTVDNLGNIGVASIPSGTVTSVGLSAGTGISIGGTNPVTTSGTISVTNTAPDQTVVLNAGTGIGVSGTYPTFTISNTSPNVPAWELSGNAGTNSGTNFIGTTDSQSLIAKINNLTIADFDIASYGVALGLSSSASGLNSFAAGTASTASGNYATASGYNNTASGIGSSALGYQNTASGVYSFAVGESSSATVSGAMVLGTTATGSGYSSLTSGDHLINSSYAQTLLGSYNDITLAHSGTSWVTTDPIFQIGNGDPGTLVRSTALTVLKNGNVGINTLTPSEKLEINGSIKITDGTQASGYVLTSDAAGKGSWQPASTGGGITHTTASGTDTYTATVTGVTSYNDGDAYLVRFTNGNTTGCTLNINSLGAVTLYRNNDGALIGGDIWAGAEMLCIYNSTLSGFQCIGTSPNSLFSYVTNADSVTITKGQVVYAFGGTGDRMTVKRALNTSDATSAQTVGVVLSTSIAANQKGVIIMQGLLDGLSILPTSTYADGDPIYLGSTAGAITNVKPYAPNHLVYVGVVTTASAGSAGRMYVKIQNGYELDELHNVQAQSPTLKDTLWYDNTVSPAQWKTASISTILGYTPLSNALNSANIFVGNGSNVATGVAMSGDVTITNAGVTAIGALKVTNAMLAGSIDLTSKVTGSLPVANGGTAGTTTLTGRNGIGTNKIVDAYAALGSSTKSYPLGLPINRLTGNQNYNLANGTVHFHALEMMEGGLTLTGMQWVQITAGAYTASNNNKVGLYSYSGGTLTLVASSATDGNLWKATSGTLGSKAFSATYTTVAGTLYYAAIIYCSSAQTTVPQLYGTPAVIQGAVVTNDYTNSAKTSAFILSQTDLPATQAMSGLTTNGNMVYLGVY